MTLVGLFYSAQLLRFKKDAAEICHRLQQNYGC